MTALPAWLAASFLFAVSGIHVYWACGGTFGFRAAVPGSDAGALFHPSKAATAPVALVMAVAAWSALAWGGAVSAPYLPGPFLQVGGWLTAAVFVIRGIGDFRWLGLFKREKSTLFARWDSLLYSPLCLLLGTALALIGLLRD